LNLSRRTNSYFTKFVGSWLKSDSIASHFVFELGGFEFLLDTIGKQDEETRGRKALEEHQEVLEGQQATSMTQISSASEDDVATSDIYEILEAGEDAGAQDAKGQGQSKQEANKQSLNLIGSSYGVVN
jgi:hypothetical protein